MHAGLYGARMAQDPSATDNVIPYHSLVEEFLEQLEDAAGDESALKQLVLALGPKLASSKDRDQIGAQLIALAKRFATSHAVPLVAATVGLATFCVSQAQIDADMGPAQTAHAKRLLGSTSLPAGADLAEPRSGGALRPPPPKTKQR